MAQKRHCRRRQAAAAAAAAVASDCVNTERSRITTDDVFVL